MTKVHWLQRATLWTAFLVSVQPHSVQKRVSWSPQPCVLVWSLKRLSELLSVSFRALLSLTTNYKRSKMFSCLICDLHEFCPNPVVKPAEEVGEQSIMQFPPWLVLHSEQFVFFTSLWEFIAILYPYWGLSLSIYQECPFSFKSLFT